MNDSAKKKLDDLVNQFYLYGQDNYSESSVSRKEINHLYEMKEHWKNAQCGVSTALQLAKLKAAIQIACSNQSLFSLTRNVSMAFL